MMPYADDHILQIAETWEQAGHDLALAVVVSTWGSSPRQPGSLMIIRDDGLIEGSVSGGCVEGAVIDAGMRAMQNAGTERLEFGVADETAWQVGLSCGGTIVIWVCAKDAMEPGLIISAASALRSRQPVHLECRMADGRLSAGDPDHAANTLSDDGRIFLLTIKARPRLFIIGAVHISQHLAPMAMQTGFDVKVIDPRTTFATEARFPGVELIADWPDTILGQYPLDAGTALVTLTHDPKIDDAALKTALPHPVFFIACLGSRRTHKARLERLEDAGIKEADLARIHGPAGFAIKAETPAEIAVSVLAQLIAARRGALESSN
ncbi:XdhC family protein [Alphaproteobacteria bacterium LSUCC0684]